MLVVPPNVESFSQSEIMMKWPHEVHVPLAKSVPCEGPVGALQQGCKKNLVTALLQLVNWHS